MENKYLLIICLGLFIVLLAIGNYVVSDYQIIDNVGEETDFVIKIANCTPIQNLSSEFIIPLEYKVRENTYGERINETHGKMCWYDVVFKKDLNETWLDENCNRTIEYLQNKYLCDKGFIVK